MPAIITRILLNQFNLPCCTSLARYIIQALTHRST